jgi:hypothetical protein
MVALSLRQFERRRCKRPRSVQQLRKSRHRRGAVPSDSQRYRKVYPGRPAIRLGKRDWADGAAPESNRPSVGLPRRTGFEDRLGHRTHAAPPASVVIGTVPSGTVPITAPKGARSIGTDPWGVSPCFNFSGETPSAEALAGRRHGGSDRRRRSAPAGAAPCGGRCPARPGSSPT